MAEIEVQIESVRQGTVSNMCTLMLKDKTAERYLPVYIGNSQAYRIKELLIGAPISEPQEPSLVDNIPGDLELMSVVINKFEDNDFYAKLRFRRGDKTKHFRVQLTEAMVAGIRKEVPILVDESVLAKSGITV